MILHSKGARTSPEASAFFALWFISIALLITLSKNEKSYSPSFFSIPKRMETMSSAANRMPLRTMEQWYHISEKPQGLPNWRLCGLYIFLWLYAGILSIWLFTIPVRRSSRFWSTDIFGCCEKVKPLRSLSLSVQNGQFLEIFRKVLFIGTLQAQKRDRLKLDLSAFQTDFVTLKTK